MINKLIKILFTLLLLVSCTHEIKSPYPGYKMIGPHLFFKFESMQNDTKMPSPNDFLIADISYAFFDNDSVFFHGIRKFQINNPTDVNSINNALFKLGKGDSATLIVNTKFFFENDLDTTVPAFLSNEKNLYIHLRIKDIEPYGDFVDSVKQMINWISNITKDVPSQDTFIEKLALFGKRGGIIKMLVDSGNGTKIEKDDTVCINYEGYFFDGRIFDSTFKRSDPFCFVYGKEKQVIPAFEIVLGKMEEKEKSLYIVPAELAFGNKGVKGIIPPNTPLVFLLQVDTVKKSIGYEN